LYLPYNNFLSQCGFSATKPADGSLLKKMRPNATNGAIYFTALENDHSDFTRRTRHGEETPAF
jgi:hypothetical protein